MPIDSAKANSLRTFEASEFKAKCLKLMDEVAKNGEEIVITKNGQPVSRLLPYRKKPLSPLGRDRDILRIHADLDEPIDVQWDAVTGRDLSHQTTGGA